MLDKLDKAGQMLVSALLLALSHVWLEIAARGALLQIHSHNAVGIGAWGGLWQTPHDAPAMTAPPPSPLQMATLAVQYKSAAAYRRRIDAPPRLPCFALLCPSATRRSYQYLLPLWIIVWTLCSTLSARLS